MASLQAPELQLIKTYGTVTSALSFKVLAVLISCNVFSRPCTPRVLGQRVVIQDPLRVEACQTSLGRAWQGLSHQVVQVVLENIIFISQLGVLTLHGVHLATWSDLLLAAWMPAMSAAPAFSESSAKHCWSSTTWCARGCLRSIKGHKTAIRPFASTLLAISHQTRTFLMRLAPRASKTAGTGPTPQLTAVADALDWESVYPEGALQQSEPLECFRPVSSQNLFISASQHIRVCVTQGPSKLQSLCGKLAEEPSNLRITRP